MSATSQICNQRGVSASRPWSVLLSCSVLAVALPDMKYLEKPGGQVVDVVSGAV